MSKFLTPPVWYDKNGNLNEMLTGEASGGGVAVGPVASAYSKGVAIGSNAQAGGDASSGGVAVGSNADASSGGIAIGSNADAASPNTIQLGDSAKTFALNVGDGTGTLKIGGIAFHKQRISNNSAIIGTPGVYLCCVTTPGDNSQVISNIAICFINSLNQPASMLSSATDLCKYSTTTEFITPKNGSTMKYCFKIVSL